jgi:23S rRNA pseudouridine2605 synthase
MQERLQKLIARAGIASRRQAEELITNGQVTVNGETAQLGTKADPETDHIKVNGKLINAKLEHRKNVYLLVNKPKGYLSTVADTKGRKLVTDLVKGFGKLHPVGRLDFQSEGLIILTNDGEFTQKVANSKKVAKVYEVKVKGLPTEVAINKLRRGTVLEDGFKTSPCEIKILAPTKNNAWYEITLYEGHNLQIRKMFDTVGHSVVKLRRIAIGNIREEKMPIGAYRELSEKELKEIVSPIKKVSTKPIPERLSKPKLEKHSRTLKPKKPKRKKRTSLSSSDIARAKAIRNSKY